MGLAGLQLASDLGDEHRAVLFGDLVLSLLRGKLGVHILKLLRGDEEYMLGQETVDELILLRYVYLGVVEGAVDVSYRALEVIKGAILLGDDLLPVPLVNVDGVDVIRLLVASYRAHIGIKALALFKAVAFKCHTLPLCKALHDLKALAGEDIKANGALHTA